MVNMVYGLHRDGHKILLMGWERISLGEILIAPSTVAVANIDLF